MTSNALLKIAAITCLLVTGGICQAHAATISDWQGCYAGVNVGYGWAKVDGTSLSNITNPGAILTYNEAIGGDTAKGGAIGGQLGCDFQYANWVLGAATSLDYARMSGSHLYINGTSPTNILKDRIKSLGTLTGRVGYLIQPNTQPYVKAGFAWTKTRHSDGDPNAFPNNLGGTGYSGSTDVTHTGWLVGAGVEQMILKNLSLFAEYEHMDFGAHNATIVYSDGGIWTFSFKQKIDTLRLGVNYHF